MNKHHDNWKERSEFWAHQERQRHHLLRTREQIRAAAEANSLATSRHIYHPPGKEGKANLVLLLYFLMTAVDIKHFRVKKKMNSCIQN